MLVVLDANTIVAAGFGQSALFRFFLSSSEIVGHSVCIPESVIEEVVAKYERELGTNVNKAKNALGNLGRHIQRSMLEPIYDLDQSQEVISYRDKLFKQLNDAHCKIVTYPDVSLKELVKKAVSRHRPFDDHGSGFRDALIWHSILELTNAPNDDIALISNDKAFRDARDKLHPNLRMDLVHHGSVWTMWC